MLVVVLLERPATGNRKHFNIFISGIANTYFSGGVLFPVGARRLLPVALIMALIALSLAPYTPKAATFVEEDITADTVWTREGSPYIITKNITINATLRVEPGVEIRIPSGVVTTVLGELVVEGSEEEPVKIIQEGEGGRWIMIVGVGARLEISNVEIPQGITLIGDYGGIYNSNASFSDIVGDINIIATMDYGAGISYSNVSFSNIKGYVSVSGYYGISESRVSFSNVRGYIDVSASVGGFFYSNVSFDNIAGSISISSAGDYSIYGSSVSFSNIIGGIDVSTGAAGTSIFKSNVSFYNVVGNINITGRDCVRLSNISFSSIAGSINLFAVSDGDGISKSSALFSDITGNISISAGITGRGISESRVFFYNIVGDISVSAGAAGIFYSSAYFYGVSGGISIFADAAGIILSNVSLFNTESRGIFVNSIYDSVFVVANSTIAYGSGIVINTAHGRVVIEHSSIYGNKPYGLIVGEGFVIAENNWWGDYSGPYHETLNPDGRGDPINASPSSVDFTPWLRSPPGEEVPHSKDTANIKETVTSTGKLREAKPGNATTMTSIIQDMAKTRSGKILGASGLSVIVLLTILTAVFILMGKRARRSI